MARARDVVVCIALASCKSSAPEQVAANGAKADGVEVKTRRSTAMNGKLAWGGLVVVTGGFTKDAEDEARNQEKRRIMLLDLRRFFDLWVEHYKQIPEANRRLLPLQPVYFLAPPQ